jgi:nucleotide-binding universal stress UspA family protein
MTGRPVFSRLQCVLVPVLKGHSPLESIRLAQALTAETVLLGMVPVADEEAVSRAAGDARRLRGEMRQLDLLPQTRMRPRVRVSAHPWEELREVIGTEQPDLTLLEWPDQVAALGLGHPEKLAELGCDLAMVRGPVPDSPQRVLVALRGGPNAELVLRMALALRPAALDVLHIGPGGKSPTDDPYRGLERVLGALPQVNVTRRGGEDIAGTILEMAPEHDLLLIGVSARLGSEGLLLGPIAETMMRRAPCGVISLMASRRLPPVAYDALVGTRAISILVDKWFAENTYSSEEFADLERLVALKRAQGLTISLALPALNEEETVGKVIRTVRRALMDDMPLLDEIVLMDSASDDRTREIAAQEGARVYVHQELLPAHGARPGKGEALWKSLLVTRGDIVAWIDTDIVNIHPRFVYGIIGPLLLDPRVQLVKGFYRRPLRLGDKMQASGGGRVTELTARPLFNLFYPELSGIVQPLAGEYAGRRGALEQVPFFSGYGVETGLLIDILERFGLSAIAQVDLMERVHHNQPLEALGKMSFSIIQVVVNRLEARTGQPILEEVNKSMKLIRHNRRGYFLEVEELAELDRPPMINLPEYQQRIPSDGEPAA